MIQFLRKNKVLVFLTLLITLGVLVFNVFHYSTNYGIVEINNINALFLVPFILLVCWFGIQLGSSRNSDKITEVYQNQLTDREQEVLRLIASGKKNQEIADELFVDNSTIKTHINNLYRKTGLQSRKELRYYFEKDIRARGNG